MSLHKFCKTVFDNHKVEIVKALQDMINAERNGEAGVDRSLLKSVIDCFITMGCIEELNDVRPCAARSEPLPCLLTTCLFSSCRKCARSKSRTTTPTAARTRWCRTCQALPKWNSAFALVRKALRCSQGSPDHHTWLCRYAAQTKSADTPTYRKDFEAAFLDDTREHYALKGREWIQEDSTSTFLIKAEKAIQAEQERVDAYLHQSSRGPLLAVVEKELLQVNQTTLLNKERSGMAALLEARQVGTWHWAPITRTRLVLTSCYVALVCCAVLPEGGGPESHVPPVQAVGRRARSDGGHLHRALQGQGR